MNFIDFVKKYPDEASCIRHFRAVKSEKVSFARSVAIRITTGTKPTIRTIAVNVATGQPFEAARLWSHRSFPFSTGCTPFT